MQARCASSFKGTRKIHGTSRLLVDTWPTSWYGLFWCFHHPGSLARLLAHRLIMSNTSKQKKQKKTCKPIIKQKQRPSWDQKILMIGHLETANIPTVDDSEILLTGLRLVLNKPLFTGFFTSTCVFKGLPLHQQHASSYGRCSGKMPQGRSTFHHLLLPFVKGYVGYDLGFLFGQWPNFPLFGITYLVRK